MKRLEIDGAASLVADESDGHVALTIDDGDEWQTIHLEYGEVARLRDWLSYWCRLMENEEVAE